ncbi:hypothetical protein [Streptosporangium sp. H16]|uniref:hypothetical protein n=1 Tax=Streptosporangium sp. H16 TaxID=3444184 RepID=UPI003F7AA084
MDGERGNERDECARATKCLMRRDAEDRCVDDLRHAGNTLAASTGASLKELMSRMGHSSTRAALIYQHASQDRDKAIAEALGKALKVARKTATKKANGTRVARKGKKSA